MPVSIWWYHHLEMETPGLSWPVPHRLFFGPILGRSGTSHREHGTGRVSNTVGQTTADEKQRCRDNTLRCVPHLRVRSDRCCYDTSATAIEHDSVVDERHEEEMLSVSLWLWTEAVRQRKNLTTRVLTINKGGVDGRERPCSKCSESFYKLLRTTEDMKK